jgi:exodeoxyribonuclease III
VRILTLNLNGIRSAAKKGAFEWLLSQDADVICVQELKAQAADLGPELRCLPGYHSAFHYAEKKGYSGVGIYARSQPDAIIEGLGVAEIDSEGRYLEARFGNLSVVSLYLPSGSSGPERQAVKFAFLAHFMPHLDALLASGREVVVCGDWNIAHTERDLKNWRGNQKNSGFLPEERAWMSALLEQGWVDSHRRVCPDAEGEAYTWWSNRGQAWANNVGWRIDYQIATPGIAAGAHNARVYKEQRFSDHAPLMIDYRPAISPRALDPHATARPLPVAPSPV